jgi:chromosomal replication initiator protein
MQDDQLKSIWKTVISGLESYLSSAQIKTWFHGSTLKVLTPHEVVITVENNYAQGYLSKFADPHLKKLLSEISGYDIATITYLIEEKEKTPSPTKPAETLFHPNTPSLPPPTQQQENRIQSNLNPKYTFDTFIVGSRNRLAFAAAQRVAEQPGVTYNPLYLYGGVGLGKTHLMQAIGNFVLSKDPSKQILYLSCESFVNEFVNSIQKSKTESFKRKYRNIDVFLVDDIQSIAGKEGTQEEFFHTFNALYQSNKQIVITSDKVPDQIPNLEERLSSRFASGLVSDIQPPDFETRQAILQAKCAEKKIVLSSEILAYIAEEIDTNIRELEGALITVGAYLDSYSITQPTLQDVKSALRKVHDNHKSSKRSNAENLLKTICDFYRISEEDLKGPRRQQELVRPRQILMYLLKHELSMTFPAIGREIGDRDHTTVIHAYEKIEKEIKRSEDFASEIQDLKERFYSLH